MKKKILFATVFILMFLPGCIIPGKETKAPEPKKIAVWWGSKDEIKAFIDSDQAQAKRWVVESVGE